MVVEPILLTD